MKGGTTVAELLTVMSYQISVAFVYLIFSSYW